MVKNALQVNVERTEVRYSSRHVLPQGSVEAREVSIHKRGGRKILFRIAEEIAAKPWLPAI